MEEVVCSAVRALGREVTGTHRMPGGSSLPTWRVTTPDGPLAVRLYPASLGWVAQGMARLATVLRTGDFPVPGVVAMVDDLPDHVALVQEWLPGVPCGEALRHEPERAWEWGAGFGQLDALPVPPEVMGEVPRLETDRPMPARPAWLHLDYHPLNVLVADGRVSAVLDWENVRLGDARADLARTLSILSVYPGLWRAGRDVREPLRVFRRGYLAGYGTNLSGGYPPSWPGQASSWGGTRATASGRRSWTTCGAGPGSGARAARTGTRPGGSLPLRHLAHAPLTGAAHTGRMTTLSLTVVPFDPVSAPPEARLAVGRLLTAAHAFDYPEDPPLLPEREAIGLTHVTPGEELRHFAVWDGEEVLGWASLEYNLTQNRHAAHARLFVHPEHRRRGLGREFARALEGVAREQGRSVVTFGTSSRAPAGEAFARTLNAQPALPMRQSRLDLAAVPDTLLDAWTTRPAGEPYRLHLWERVPEAFLERTADLMMVMNTAPRGELEVDDWTITPEMIRAWEGMIAEGGEVRFLMATEDSRTGELAGYTEVFWSPERAALVFQGATAVRPAARGQGLGKWLKAVMLRHVRTHCPGARWVRTNNADENAAMLGINVALGFEPWANFTEWQVRLA